MVGREASAECDPRSFGGLIGCLIVNGLMMMINAMVRMDWLVLALIVE
jgi:hypothetical protein